MPSPKLSEQLQIAGMSRAQAGAKEDAFTRIAGAWRGWSPLVPTRAWFVPGRVELLGKHTDYAGGRSLLCALERGFCLLAAPRPDRRMRLLDIRSGQPAEFDVDQAVPLNWARYPALVARHLAAEGRLPLGADIAFASDLPPSAGMSSSSAFIVASYCALVGDGELGERG
ncbi:MAG: galactokinase family protein, partial [Terriglobales bacterium]